MKENIVHAMFVVCGTGFETEASTASHFSLPLDVSTYPNHRYLILHYAADIPCSDYCTNLYVLQTQIYFDRSFIIAA